MSEPSDDSNELEVQANRTWWERNAIPVMGLVSVLMLVFVIVFQTSC